jgi:hypothetical protein
VNPSAGVTTLTNAAVERPLGGGVLASRAAVVRVA